MGRLKLESRSCHRPCSSRPQLAQFLSTSRQAPPPPCNGRRGPSDLSCWGVATPPQSPDSSSRYCVAWSGAVVACLPGWGLRGAGLRSRGHVYLQQAVVLLPDRFPEIWACTLTLLECASAMLSVCQMFAAAFCIKFWASLQDLAVLLLLGGTGGLPPPSVLQLPLFC